MQSFNTISNVTKFQGLQNLSLMSLENLTPFIQKCALSSQLKFKMLPVIMLMLLILVSDTDVTGKQTSLAQIEFGIKRLATALKLWSSQPYTVVLTKQQN